MTTEPRHEAVILVRIDDMSTFQTVGQRSIRFPLPTGDEPAEDLNELVGVALREAPPLEEWQGF
jgi:hypothetical protein